MKCFCGAHPLAGAWRKRRKNDLVAAYAAQSGPGEEIAGPSPLPGRNERNNDKERLRGAGTFGNPCANAERPVTKMKQDEQQTAKYARKHQRKKRWYRVVTCLAAVVVFCTTYALILPAITLERTTPETAEAATADEMSTDNMSDIVADVDEGVDSQAKMDGVADETEPDLGQEDSMGAGVNGISLGSSDAEQGESVRLADSDESGNTVSDETSGTDPDEAEELEESADAAQKETLPGVTITGVIKTEDGYKIGATYDPETDTFETGIRINFEFEEKPTAGAIYTYTYPKGITIPDEVISKGAQTLYDGDKVAGTYQFVRNEDETYSVQIVFNANYINGSGDKVTGYVQFEGSFDKEALNENGNIVYGGDTSTILVSAKDIIYPADETETYNIDVSKSGTWVQDGDKLVYTVYVRTTKGTPDPIELTDTVTIPEGLELGSPTVTIEKGTANYYDNWTKEPDSWETLSGYRYSDGTDGTLTIKLRKLSAQEKTDSNNTGYYIEGEVYRISYAYPILDQTVSSVSPENKVTVSAKDANKGQTVTDSDQATVNVTKDLSYQVDKSGAVASDKPGYIKWTITVNSNKVDIAGAKLTDEMFGLNATDIVVYPQEGTAIEKDSEDKITGITFSQKEDGKNKDTYTITYYTAVEESWDGTTVTNKATLDPTPEETGGEKEATASVTVDGVKLNKVGTYNAANNTINWTITVNSGKLDIAGATLTDEMFGALDQNRFTIEPQNGYSFTQGTDDKVAGITFTAVQDEKNTQTYTIQYSTPVTENADGSVNPVTNTATLSPGEGKDGTPIGTQTTVTPQGLSLTKDGRFDNSSNEIKWTVTVNESGYNIAGAEFKDTMLDTLAVGDITVYDGNWRPIFPGDGHYDINTDDNGKVKNIIFHAIGETGANTGKYFITYSTQTQREWNDKTVRNDARLTLNGKNVDASKEVTVPAEGSIAKNVGSAQISEDGKTATIPWTVTLTVPSTGLPAGTTIVDDVTKNQYGNVNTNQWMTRSQITTWATNLIWTDESGNHLGGTNTYNPPPEQVTFLASNGTTYTYKQISEYKAPADEGEVNFEELRYTLFNIYFPENVPPPQRATKLTFTYSTTVDLTQATPGENIFYNDIKVGNRETSSQYRYYNSGVVKTDGNGGTGTTQVSSDGTVTWNIKATVGENKHKLTLTDTLPEGVTLESLQLSGAENLNMELAVSGEVISGTDTTNQYNVSGTYKNNVITLNIEPSAGGGVFPTGTQFTLTVNCKVTDAENQTEQKTLVNTAEMTLDDVEIGSSSQTQQWTYQKAETTTKVVDKTGEWDNTNRIMDYTIILNPEGKKLAEGSDTLTLVDTMSYTNQVYLYYPVNGTYSVNASLLQSSVKLYKAKRIETGEWVPDLNQEISNWNWTYEEKTGQNDWDAHNVTSTIRATGIPDGTPLVLKYSYRVTSNAPDKQGENTVTFDLKFKNKAELEGTSYSNEFISSDAKWELSTSSAGVTTDKSYTFYKVEAGNYNVSLEGATFSVYKYDADKSTYSTDPVKTYTTDNNGSFRITRQEKDSEGTVTFSYETNTLYKVTETTPPTGYQLPDEVKTFYFYFSSTEDTWHTLPTSLPNDAVDLASEAKTVYVENVKNATEITVNKQWFRSDGTMEITSTKAGSISFGLYQIASTTPPSGSGGGATGGSPGSDGSVTLTVGIKDENSSYVYVQDLNGTLGSTNTSISVPVGTTVTVTLECRYGSSTESWAQQWKKSSATANGTSLTRTEQNGGNIYIFAHQVTENTTIDVWKNWGTEATATVTIDTTTATPTDPDEPPSAEPVGTLYDTYTISNTGGWTWSKDDLPLTGKDEAGNTVYYTYYVVENSGTNYSTSYENNGGIVSGTITIKNTESDTPVYTLPETGGGGTTPYTVGGLALMAGAGLLLLYNHSKRRKEDLESS